LQPSEYAAKLTAAAFVDVLMEPTHVYALQGVKEIVGGIPSKAEAGTLLHSIDGPALSAFVRACKPAL
jgi:hypothetical protein